ncbi:hypothetical protein SUGI_0662500 [Cryptomeria japonica]|uniref:OVARIAN TUMOR DOMAIN-containing deubiquitinating enzyme 7-like n=1 Tax=Cryptomeria japonica TaxID=3369 RepID=UPI002414CE69|nr:OVARIAN TUMOR DOMAIN-containing deubiquitinating enzyme 7-like [Cryptomeria japonica]GLJ32895.1 hypothetical protein SUGI_0662500 [Cryptomeria japonica]
MVRVKFSSKNERISMVGSLPRPTTPVEEDKKQAQLSTLLDEDQEKNTSSSPQADDEEDDIQAQFEAHLDESRLRMEPMLADGNCFFRALADQIEGDQEQHSKYRQMVVEYIMNHRSHFEPFFSQEDDFTFEEYCETLAKDGTWADHCELQAASMLTRTNIRVHRLKDQPSDIYNFHPAEVPTLNLSYHDGNHYNSLRSIDDNAAPPILIEEDKSTGHSHNESVKFVVDRTGCADDETRVENNFLKKKDEPQRRKSLSEWLPWVPRKKKCDGRKTSNSEFNAVNSEDSPRKHKVKKSSSLK